MRTAKSWVDVIHPAAHLGAEGELERQIKRIQDDALDFASLLVLDHKWQKGSMNFNQGFISGKILSHRSDGSAAQPNVPDEQRGANT